MKKYAGRVNTKVITKSYQIIMTQMKVSLSMFKIKETQILSELQRRGSTLSHEPRCRFKIGNLIVSEF